MTGDRDSEQDDGPHASRRTVSLVHLVFREVWQEFHAWEQHDSNHAITSLQDHASSRPSNGSEWRWVDEARFSRETDAGASTTTIQQTKTDSTETFTSFDLTSSESQQLQITCYEVTGIEEYPVYESCAPLAQNILHGDDSENMPFIPFADDSSFDVEHYMADYRGFKWQGGCVDTDISAIVLETANRLYRERGLTLNEIEATRILPQRLRSSSSHWGTIWTSTQNDQITWSGPKATTDVALVDKFPPQEDDLHRRLQDYCSLFCPKLSCMQAVCPSHNDLSYATEPADRTDTSPRAKRPQSDRDNFTACGPHCHLLSSKDSEVTIPWTEHEQKNVLTLIQLAPAATACELSVLCCKPCWQVPLILETLANPSADGGILLPAGSGPNSTGFLDNDGDSAQGNHYLAADNDARIFVPCEPCTHNGPCDDRCPCAQNKGHCMRECRCGDECARRWKGCRCGHRRSLRTRACGSEWCPCKQANRECDPELCISCDFKSTFKGSCRNVQIQTGRHKRTRVAKSAHGLGLFLDEPAREGDLISEYVGELIYEPTFDTRGQLSDHRGRSYVFQLNQLMSTDSTYAGNDARFLNGVSSKRSNCIVEIPLINGEHRIGIFAKKSLPTGTELLLDYGPAFYYQVARRPSEMSKQ